MRARLRIPASRRNINFLVVFSTCLAAPSSFFLSFSASCTLNVRTDVREYNYTIFLFRSSVVPRARCTFLCIFLIRILRSFFFSFVVVLMRGRLYERSGQDPFGVNHAPRDPRVVFIKCCCWMNASLEIFCAVINLSEYQMFRLYVYVQEGK